MPTNLLTKYEFVALHVAEFLALPEIAKLRQCSRLLDSSLRDCSSLYAELLLRALRRSGRAWAGLTAKALQIQLVAEGCGPQDILKCLLRLSPWPTDWDRAALYHRLGPGNVVELEDGRRIVYNGHLLGRNRSICANDHFPCLLDPHDESSSAGALVRSFLPFPVVRPAETGGGQTTLSLTHIAYFEAVIHEMRPEEQQLQQRIQEGALLGAGNNNNNDDDEDEEEEHDEFQGQPPCVAVGIACPGDAGFLLGAPAPVDKMPGWDSSSFAYHSDDGRIFSGRATGGERCRIAPTLVTRVLGADLCEPSVIEQANERPFGSKGDVVGCGIVYPTGCALIAQECGAENRGLRNTTDTGLLFFTKNGKIIHAAPFVSATEQRPSRLSLPWFPVVGTDCHFPVSVRFGHEGEAFAFNVALLERRLMGGAPPSDNWTLNLGLATTMSGPLTASFPLIPSLTQRECHRMLQLHTLPLVLFEPHAKGRGQEQIDLRCKDGGDLVEERPWVQNAGQALTFPEPRGSTLKLCDSGGRIKSFSGYLVSSFPHKDVVRLLMSNRRLFLSNKDEFGYEGGLSLFLSDAMAAVVRYVKMAYVAPEQQGQQQQQQQGQQQQHQGQVHQGFLEIDDFFDGGEFEDDDEDEDEDDEDDDDGFDEEEDVDEESDFEVELAPLVDPNGQGEAWDEEDYDDDDDESIGRMYVMGRVGVVQHEEADDEDEDEDKDEDEDEDEDEEEEDEDE